MTTFEIGTYGGLVILTIAVADGDAGRSVFTVPMVPDEAKSIVNTIGQAIHELATEVRT